MTFELERPELYGDAAAALQQILALWMSIEWFAVPKHDDADRAIALLETHQALGHRHLPELFPALNVSLRRGGPEHFVALRRAQARDTKPWDWKYGALKVLSRRHSQEHGWTLQGQTQLATDVASGDTTGYIFQRVGELVMPALPSPSWNPRGPAMTSASFSESARWYRAYALMDALACVEWQLAESSAPLTTNPLLPLLQCYATGHLPFSHGPSEMQLFSFDE